MSLSPCGGLQRPGSRTKILKNQHSHLSYEQVHCGSRAHGWPDQVAGASVSRRPQRLGRGTGATKGRGENKARKWRGQARKQVSTGGRVSAEAHRSFQKWP